MVDRPLNLAKTITGPVRLVFDADHFDVVVREGMLAAKVSLDIATADFKAMLVPQKGSSSRRAPSIVQHLRKLADKGVEIRLLHAGTPSSAALQELRKALPERLTIRRCPRLHAKAVVIDCRRMYLGSANLTGAGLGAKGEGKRNFELGSKGILSHKQMCKWHLYPAATFGAAAVGRTARLVELRLPGTDSRQVDHIGHPGHGARRGRPG